MLLKIIVCFAIVVNAVISDTVKDELSAVYNSHGQPYHELPCSVIGGICAKEGSCPTNSEVVVKGLCPVQQEDGIECCKPKEPIIRCRSRGGDCISTFELQCPDSYTVGEATDCGKNEACCIFIK